MEKNRQNGYFSKFFEKYSKYNNEIKISWHGGEPLLVGLNVFKEILNIASKYKIKVRSSIQSNGILLNEEWADFFLKNDFHVGISIDGLPNYHNKMRPPRNKRKNSVKSYDGALKAINLLKRKRVRFGTLTVISPSQDGTDIFRHLLEIGVENMDFLLPIISTKKDAYFVEGCAKYLLDILEDWLTLGDSKIKIRYFENIIKAIIGGKAKQCILSNSCSKYITIEPNGDIGFCENTRVIGDDFYNTGMNILNNSFSEIDTYTNRRLKSIKYNTLGEECKDCNYVTVCNGGCPVARFSDSGRFNNRSVYCELYKTVIYRIYREIMNESNESVN